MDFIEIKAQSVDSAIEEGLKELKATIDQVNTEIISKGGLFKKAVVKLTLKATTTEIATPVAKAVDIVVPVAQSAATSSDDATQLQTGERPTKAYVPREPDKEVDINSLTGGDKVCVDFLSSLLKNMQLECYLKITSSADKLSILICGKDTNNAIGFRGETLVNIQYLTLLVANKNTRFRKKLIIDADGYREKRAETLTELSRKLAFKVAKTGTAVELEPMNPFERRVIHTALQNDRYVTTSSEGSEPYRFIVISPKAGGAAAEPSNDRRDYKPRERQSDYKPRERRDDYLSRERQEDITTPSESNTESLTATAVTAPEVAVEVDMYDQSSKSSFKKSGAGKTRSFGSKARRF